MQAPDTIGPIYGARCHQHKLACPDYWTTALKAINALRNLHIERKVLREVPLCHKEWEVTEIRKEAGQPVVTTITHPNRDH